MGRIRYVGVYVICIIYICVCVCVCIYVYVCVYMYVCMYVYVSVFVSCWLLGVWNALLVVKDNFCFVLDFVYVFLLVRISDLRMSCPNVTCLS